MWIVHLLPYSNTFFTWPRWCYIYGNIYIYIYIYIYINSTYATDRPLYKHISSKLIAVCYCYSTVRISQLQTSNYVTFLEGTNMVASHWQWYGSSTSRKWMSQYSSMTATCRLHTEILHCNTGHVIGWTVTHFKTLGTTELWCSMYRELLETHRWNYDVVSQIFTYRQIHKLINRCIIIKAYLLSGITADWLFVCILFLLLMLLF